MRNDVETRAYIHRGKTQLTATLFPFFFVLLHFKRYCFLLRICHSSDAFGYITRRSICLNKVCRFTFPNSPSHEDIEFNIKLRNAIFCISSISRLLVLLHSHLTKKTIRIGFKGTCVSGAQYDGPDVVVQQPDQPVRLSSSRILEADTVKATQFELDWYPTTHKEEVKQGKSAGTDTCSLFF